MRLFHHHHPRHHFHPHSAKDGVVPLSALNSGERGIIESIEAHWGMLSRLTSLGFTPGAEIEMLQNFHRGPLMVCVRETCVALGRGEASKILVSRKESK
jgi:ferrous iron transport protein A